MSTLRSQLLPKAEFKFQVFILIIMNNKVHVHLLHDHGHGKESKHAILFYASK